MVKNTSKIIVMMMMMIGLKNLNDKGEF